MGEVESLQRDKGESELLLVGCFFTIGRTYWISETLLCSAMFQRDVLKVSMGFQFNFLRFSKYTFLHS